MADKVESEWSYYYCKSGELLFFYNKVTGEHRWPNACNMGFEGGQAIYGHHMQCASTQTDDYDCINGCLSPTIHTEKLVSGEFLPSDDGTSSIVVKIHNVKTQNALSQQETTALGDEEIEIVPPPPEFDNLLPVQLICDSVDDLSRDASFSDLDNSSTQSKNLAVFDDKIPLLPIPPFPFNDFDLQEELDNPKGNVHDQECHVSKDSINGIEDTRSNNPKGRNHISTVSRKNPLKISDIENFLISNMKENDKTRENLHAMKSIVDKALETEVPYGSGIVREENPLNDELQLVKGKSMMKMAENKQNLSNEDINNIDSSTSQMYETPDLQHSTCEADQPLQASRCLNFDEKELATDDEGRTMNINEIDSSSINQPTEARTCQLCSLNLQTSINYYNHLREEHCSQEIDKCPICKASFRHRRYLFSHLHTHCGTRGLQAKYVCLDCNKNCLNFENLEDHKSTHTGVKHHKCDLCEMAFHFRLQLKNHKEKVHKRRKRRKRIAENDSTHVTKSAKKRKDTAFSETGNLILTDSAKKQSEKQLKHSEVNAVHDEISTTTAIPVEGNLSDTAVNESRFDYNCYIQEITNPITSLKKYLCRVCSKSYATRRYLKDHLSVHTGKKNYSCQVCFKSFRYGAHLSLHKKKHCCSLPTQTTFLENAQLDGHASPEFKQPPEST